MERLTFNGDFCDIAQCFEIRGGKQCPDGYCSQRRVWERLKQYEDTGLEPEDIEALKRERDAAVLDLIMLGSCETCSKDCGITKDHIIGCGCKDYIWRGEVCHENELPKD